MAGITYTQPLLLVFLLITTIGMLRRHRGTWLAALGIVGLFLLSWPPADYLFSRAFEARYPVEPFTGGDAQAIVVLSGAVDPPHYERPFYVADRETYERCELGAWLYSHWRSVPVLVSGGANIEDPQHQPYSQIMRSLVQRAGVPEASIWIEDQSRSTHENAVFSAQILRAKGINRIVLITEAQSMLRAELCFRKEGFVVLPAPSEIRQWTGWGQEFLPSWKAIYRNEGALHEALGLAWYRLRGWI